MGNKAKAKDSEKNKNIPADTDIINELREAIALQRTKKPEFVANLINNIMAKEFANSKENAKYSNAILKIKEYIANIKYKCSLRYTHRIIIVSAVLDELDGDA